MTRVPELLAQGIDVAFGHDCVMDPWYSLGSADMLEVAQMGLHVAQMTGQKAMRQCYEAVTEAPARILGLSDYGLRPGARADAVLLQARDPVEAIRPACHAPESDSCRSRDREYASQCGTIESSRPARRSGLATLSELATSTLCFASGHPGVARHVCGLTPSDRNFLEPLLMRQDPRFPQSVHR